MINSLLTKIFGSRNQREMKRLAPKVDLVNSFEPALKALTDEQLKGKTAEFKERLAKGETLDDILPEAFAVVREASQRVMGMRPFDVQLLGGMILHEGRIAEMRTGEGKTLVATLPVYLNALTGKGVHVVTVNDYLAERDSLGRGSFKGMSTIYNFLGLTCGVIKHGLSHRARQEAYACDITYGTNNELGFDYLRDNMATHIDHTVQRELNYAIVDEVDSILVDEARTPLIISGPSEESTDLYYKVDRIIPALEKGKEKDYDVEEKTRSAFLTETGVRHVEQLLKVDNLYDHKNVQLVHHVTQALKAHVIFKRDVDYIVKDGEVVIVDEFTGRLMQGRRYSDGLHQALEAKERVKIEAENQTLATITFQNFFRMYKKLAGMTGTAETEAAEFAEIYKLEVFTIPTHRNMVRLDEADAVYRSQKEKYNAIVDDVATLHAKNQPVLVGTVSIEKNEMISEMLKKRGVKHEVLNAKFHEREAEIISAAGQPGAVTIATNMAGRGTDIVLGAGMKDVGGLAVFGTERHESRRIDNQLRGRSGRQGDPGLSRFYVSLEDDLMRIFGSDRLKDWMTRLGMQDGEVISHPWVSKSIERAQKAVESHNFDIRKHLLEYDDVMNKQREVIYRERNRVLREKDIRAHMLAIVDDVAVEAVDLYAAEKTKVEDWDLEGLKKWFHGLTQTALDWKEENLIHLDRDALYNALKEELMKAYEAKEKALTPEVTRNLERAVILQMVDTQWKDHLLSMDHLKEGIGLQSYGGKDPLIEYKREGFAMFNELLGRIKEDSLKLLLLVKKVDPDDELFESTLPSNIKEEHPEFDSKAVVAQAPAPVAAPQPQAMMGQNAAPAFNAPMGGQPWETQGNQAQQPVAKVATIRRDEPKLGRNDPCYCGSGKKYKKCHGASK
jgi:preprotein translocase subunit SecA